MIKDDLGVVQRSISPPTNSVTCSAWTTPTTTTRSEDGATASVLSDGRQQTINHCDTRSSADHTTLP